MNNLFHEIFLALWFFVPAGVANVTPVFAAHIPWLKDRNLPVDFGKKYRGKRIFGSHKTWRGLIVGVIFATLVLQLQVYLVGNSEFLQEATKQIGYLSLPVFVLGPLFGLGALMGDSIESFFKRQRDIKEGDGWFPFDQTDYIIGGAIATMPFVQLSLVQYGLMIFLWLVIHIISTVIGYALGLKDRPI